jgi:REP element-mobilizing transposase RayT
MSDEAKQHTSIGEMARECAEHRGVMIVDIEVKPDGETHIHAVATWEPLDAGR